MLSFFMLLDIVAELYAWTVVSWIVLNWLIAFQVVNLQNLAVYKVCHVLNKMVEPALEPIRRRLPNFGGIDISPMVVLLLIYFIRSLLREYGPL